MSTPVEPQKALRCGHGLRAKLEPYFAMVGTKQGWWHGTPGALNSTSWARCDRPPEPSAVPESMRQKTRFYIGPEGEHEDAPEPSAAEGARDWDALNALVERLDARLAAARADVDQLTAERDEWQRDHDDVLDHYLECQAERDAARAELARLRQQIQAVRALLDERESWHADWVSRIEVNDDTVYDGTNSWVSTAAVRAALAAVRADVDRRDEYIEALENQRGRLRAELAAARRADVEWKALLAERDTAWRVADDNLAQIKRLERVLARVEALCGGDDTTIREILEGTPPYPDYIGTVEARVADAIAEALGDQEAS